MTLTHRFLRRLGYDTTKIVREEFPRYKYTITHLNGEVTKVTANGHRYKEGFLNVWSYTNSCSHYDHLMGPLWSRTIDKRLEGIQEIERKRIETTFLDAEVDKTDCTIEDVTIRHG